MRISDWSSDVCSSDLLGNYLGAIRNWVRMQDEMDSQSQCFFFLADMHSITVHEGREQRIRNVRYMAAALVAAGIDPDRSVLFNQARVPAHAELCWLLNGTARIGWLNRMRSEEHTSELQSLMRLSSAVFCLKKK